MDALASYAITNEQGGGRGGRAISDGAEVPVVGIRLAIGVSPTFLVAVFLSNVPEGLSAAGMKKAGRKAGYTLGLWGSVAAASALSALFGYLFLAGAPRRS